MSRDPFLAALLRGGGEGPVAVCKSFDISLAVVRYEPHSKFYSEETKDWWIQTQLKDKLRNLLAEGKYECVSKVEVIHADNCGPSDLWLMFTTGDTSTTMKEYSDGRWSNKPGFVVPRGHKGYLPAGETVMFCAEPGTCGAPLNTMIGLKCEYDIDGTEKTRFKAEQKTPRPAEKCDKKFSVHVRLRVHCTTYPSSAPPRATLLEGYSSTLEARGSPSSSSSTDPPVGGSARPYDSRHPASYPPSSSRSPSSSSPSFSSSSSSSPSSSPATPYGRFLAPTRR